MNRVCRALLLVFLTAPAPVAADDPERIGGRDESAWREQAHALAGEIEWLEARVEECEESEAPPAYDGVGGYWVRGRDGRLRRVEVKRCDEQRAELSAARGALDRFEERARRLGVPPGWLR